jgi:SAM-dependent methyltransferase
MREEMIGKLLGLNRDFYRQFAQPFVETRTSPQAGFFRLLDYLPKTEGLLLDVGCGDGRFGRFALEHGLVAGYTGVDFSAEMLQAAHAATKQGDFFQRDLSEPNCLQGLGLYDMISCLAAMQHIPGRNRRLQLLREMASHLRPDGRIILSNWQFLESTRQQRKIVEWQQIGLRPEDVEENDYLLTWQRGGTGFRYVCFIDAAETAALASEAGLRCLVQFRSDGREGNLNLYTLLVV